MIAPPQSEEVRRLWADTRERWQAGDLARLALAIDARLAQMAKGRDAAQVATVLHWLEELNEQDPVCALAVAERLERLLALLDADGLARWILGGMRRCAGHTEQQRAYFRLEEPCAVEALHAEAGHDALAQALPSLALLLHGLAEKHHAVQPLRQRRLHAAPLRPILAPTHLLLPDDYTAADAPDRWHLYRAAVAHAAAHLRHSLPGRSVKGLKPMGVAVVSAIEDARVERLLMRDFPGVRGWFLPFLRQRPAGVDLSFEVLLWRMSRALMDPEFEDDSHWVRKARSLFEAHAHRLEDYEGFRRFASVLANDLGQMRVRFNPQQYLVSPAYRDDNSFLWDHGPSQLPPPEALLLQQPQSASPPPPPDDGADAPEQAAAVAADVELGRYGYHEWDHRLRLHRSDWCTVIEKLPAWQGLGATAPTASLPSLPPLRHGRRLHRAQRLRRQWEGDELDLNAAVEVVVERRMQLAPSPRLFMKPGLRQPVCSVLVLLDLSASVNDPTGTDGPPVLALEKQAALMLANAVQRGPGRVAVHGFSSDTRAQVYYYRMLDFGRPLDDGAIRTIQSVQGRYSTRMGAAIRHACALLAQETADQRVILMITDGAPSDVDVFDSAYLARDAQMAVHEARQSAVQVGCVALDPQADRYVRAIFGWRNYRVADEPAALHKHLASLYSSLAAG